MYSYFAYGLGIRSTLPFPELERAGSKEHGAGSGEVQDFGFRISDFGFGEQRGAGCAGRGHPVWESGPFSVGGHY